MSIVAALATKQRHPVFLKMRCLPSPSGSQGQGGTDVAATVALAVSLQEAGVAVLALHGRTREQKCACECDWDAIRAVKRALAIPVIANGGVETPEDIAACLERTECDAVMVSEAALENPAIFAAEPLCRSGQLRFVREYVSLARQHPPRSITVVKAHLFKLLFMALEQHKHLRELLGAAKDMEGASRQRVLEPNRPAPLNGRPANVTPPPARPPAAALFVVAEECCRHEEAAIADGQPHMDERCDGEGAPFVSWYRRHRQAQPQAGSA